MFAFHYEQPLSRQQLEWYSKFDVRVTHDPLPKAQVDWLGRRGTRLVLYEWAVAFYDSRATQWQKTLLKKRGALLNDHPLRGALGSPTADAWYFDPASTVDALARANEIAQRLRDIGYDGVFLDTTTVASVHPEARAEYERRHPELSYDEAYSRFLAALRTALGTKIIFTNQGYRDAAHYLPYADYDLTESLITRPEGNDFVLRPWNDGTDPWNSIHYLMLHLIQPAQRQYPKVKFAHLNYISHSDDDLVRDTVAISRLFDAEGYVATTRLEDEMSGLYFHDLGEPVAERVDSTDAQSSYRFFSRGLVAVNAGPTPLVIPNRNRATYVSDDGAEYSGENFILKRHDDETLTSWVLTLRK